MPYLSIQTSVNLGDAEKQSLLASASRSVADMLGKPEGYVMVTLHSGLSMMFAGSNEPAAYLDLKSLGLPAERTAELSAALCDLMRNELGIDSSRIYIGFVSPDRFMWGWNGKTF